MKLTDWYQRLDFPLGKTVKQAIPIGGGSIANSYRLITETGESYFFKTGYANRMFRCEAHGLQELRKAATSLSDATIRVPQVIEAGDDFLLLEYIPSGRPSGHFFQAFGRALAEIHRYSASGYGFWEDNYIGATPQPNRPKGSEASSWAAFYLNKRLRFQLELAEENGYATPTLQRGFTVLENRLDEILAGSEEPPALLHGDLWGGNYLCDEDIRPVLIDPAVYYGHREADLAMTRMFGGFTREFYAAYQNAYPLKPGWQDREPVYLLYHVLNHLNLFGRAYLPQAESILQRSVAGHGMN